MKMVIMHKMFWLKYVYIEVKSALDLEPRAEDSGAIEDEVCLHNNFSKAFPLAF